MIYRLPGREEKGQDIRGMTGYNHAPEGKFNDYP